MAMKPLTSEAIALTEKKMDMTLDDIIKMSKTNPAKAKKHRTSNQSQKIVNNAARDKSVRVQRFMDSRASLRQGVLVQRRSQFQGNQFPLTTEAARKAAVAPIRNRAFRQIRAVNVNKPRFVVAPPMQRNAANRGFAVKQQQLRGVNLGVVKNQQQQKQRPQTLDSLFANMKVQRMRALSQQHNTATSRRRRNGGARRQQQQQQWVGSRFPQFI